MAQFDVFRLPDGSVVLDCQADRFDDIGTRFVVPLMPPEQAPPLKGRLNPRFEINGVVFVMVTQFATALRTVELRSHLASLDGEHLTIVGAIDVLTGSG